MRGGLPIGGCYRERAELDLQYSYPRWEKGWLIEYLAAWIRFSLLLYMLLKPSLPLTPKVVYMLA